MKRLRSTYLTSRFTNFFHCPCPSLPLPFFLYHQNHSNWVSLVLLIHLPSLILLPTIPKTENRIYWKLLGVCNFRIEFLNPYLKETTRVPFRALLYSIASTLVSLTLTSSVFLVPRIPLLSLWKFNYAAFIFMFCSPESQRLLLIHIWWRMWFRCIFFSKKKSHPSLSYYLVSKYWEKIRVALSNLRQAILLSKINK